MDNFPLYQLLAKSNITIKSYDELSGIILDLDGHEIQTRADIVEIMAAYAIINAGNIRRDNARSNAKAIPSWSSWTEAETLAWIDTNIGTPLSSGRANLPATLTLATARTAITTLISIMDKMLVVLIALARMVVAMRNQIWPDLQDR